MANGFISCKPIAKFYITVEANNYIQRLAIIFLVAVLQKEDHVKCVELASLSDTMVSYMTLK